MENTTPNSTDVKNTVDNFEAVIASGNVTLIDQNGDVKLYRGDDGVTYIYDGANAYSEGTADFARMSAEYFGSPNPL